jgi:hypothetical protein
VPITLSKKVAVDQAHRAPKGLAACLIYFFSQRSRWCAKQSGLSCACILFDQRALVVGSLDSGFLCPRDFVKALAGAFEWFY